MDYLDKAVRAYADADAAVGRAQAEAKRAVADAVESREKARQAVEHAVVQAYRQGVRVNELARRTGRDRETIRRYLRNAGL